MAEAKKNEEAQESGEAKPAGGKKKLIILILVGLVTVGLSVGATIFFLGGSSKDDAEAESAEAHAEGEHAKAAALYLDIVPSLLITLDANGRQRYMKVDVSLQARDKAALDAVNLHMPLIRSRVLSTYSNINFAEIQTEPGKLKMLENTLAVINEVLKGEGAPLIDNVFLTNFVLQ